MNSFRVFVVDNEKVIARTLAEILSRRGFSARPFSSPLDALAAVRADIPDLLISDISMPGLSGIDLAIRVKEECPQCKVLLFSGQPSSFELLEDVRREHDFRMLEKPFHPSLLFSEIDRLSPVC
jgi:DNA-binding NtrC family response regulator